MDDRAVSGGVRVPKDKPFLARYGVPPLPRCGPLLALAQPLSEGPIARHVSFPLLRARQGEHHGTEQAVLGLLRRRQLVERQQARVGLGHRILHGAIYPALG